MRNVFAVSCRIDYVLTAMRQADETNSAITFVAGSDGRPLRPREMPIAVGHADVQGRRNLSIPIDEPIAVHTFARSTRYPFGAVFLGIDLIEKRSAMIPGEIISKTRTFFQFDCAEKCGPAVIGKPHSVIAIKGVHQFTIPPEYCFYFPVIGYGDEPSDAELRLVRSKTPKLLGLTGD